MQIKIKPATRKRIEKRNGFSSAIQRSSSSDDSLLGFGIGVAIGSSMSDSSDYSSSDSSSSSDYSGGGGDFGGGGSSGDF